MLPERQRNIIGEITLDGRTAQYIFLCTVVFEIYPDHYTNNTRKHKISNEVDISWWVILLPFFVCCLWHVNVVLLQDIAIVHIGHQRSLTSYYSNYDTDKMLSGTTYLYFDKTRLVRSTTLDANTNSVYTIPHRKVPAGPRWAPCWPHEPCYLGCLLVPWLLRRRWLLHRHVNSRLNQRGCVWSSTKCPSVTRTISMPINNLKFCMNTIQFNRAALVEHFGVDSGLIRIKFILEKSMTCMPQHAN